MTEDAILSLKGVKISFSELKSMIENICKVDNYKLCDASSKEKINFYKNSQYNSILDNIDRENLVINYFYLCNLINNYEKFNLDLESVEMLIAYKIFK